MATSFSQTAMFRPLVVKLKVHEDNWNDEQRVRVSIIRVEPTDLVRECSVSRLLARGRLV